MILAVVIVIFEKSPVMQCCIMIFLSFWWLCYIIQVRPFENRVMNIMETFNETMFLFKCYTMLTFSDFNNNYVAKYYIGWGFIFAELFQILINLLVVLIITLNNLLNSLKQQFCKPK